MAETLPHLLKETAARFPGNIAICDLDRRVSYLELDRSSDRIASFLRPPSIPCHRARVGIFRPKNADTVAIVHGIMKASCAYVPFDIRMPVHRLSAILGGAGAEGVFTDVTLLPQLIKALELANVRYAVSTTSICDISDCVYVSLRNAFRGAVHPLASDDVAYILYTSGSTGQPKGVQQSHHSAATFARWAAAEFSITPTDVLSCHAPLHFDLTTLDLFAAVATGAGVVLIPESIAIFPRRVAELVERFRISIWYSVPFALIQMVEKGGLRERDLSALRHIIFAGERFPPPQLRELHAAVPDALLTNLFGPTETNVCLHHRLTQADINANSFCPAGRPCSYASIRIVDHSGNDVREGGTGELYVAGPTVMLGYLGLSEETASRFVEDTQGILYYRTGDLVVSTGTSVLFRGRMDRQVKIRGFRIELDEIEAALLNIEGIGAAVVWTSPTGDGYDTVVAAVESEVPGALTEHDLRREISTKVPAAAVPSTIHLLPAFPRNSNGKIDLGLIRAECVA